MTTLRLDIVGLWFKPPATRLIKCLPLDVKLELCHEPTNPVDPNAVAVWLPIDQLRLTPRVGFGANLSILAAEIYDCFHPNNWLEKVKPGETVQAETYDEFRELAAFQLGYIPAVHAAALVEDGFHSAMGTLKWREAENARRAAKPQIEFDDGE